MNQNALRNVSLKNKLFRLIQFFSKSKNHFSIDDEAKQIINRKQNKKYIIVKVNSHKKWTENQIIMIYLKWAYNWIWNGSIKQIVRPKYSSDKCKQVNKTYKQPKKQTEKQKIKNWT